MRRDAGRQQNAGRTRWLRRFGAAAAVLLLLVCGATALIGNYFVNFAIARKDYAMEVAPADAVSPEDMDAMDAGRVAYAKLRDQVLQDPALERETVDIESADGLRLEADFYRMAPSASPETASAAEAPTALAASAGMARAEDAGSSDGEARAAGAASHRYVIVVHGYQSSRSTELSRNYISVYLQQGFQVLAPDNRAHGGSEGQYIGMGWLDRKDLLAWIQFLIDRDPQAEIYVHGVSMGGAAVMMLSGESLPENVKALVEDCGYTSVWDEFESELAYLYRLPAFPVLYMADVVAGVRAGYHFQEASSTAQLRKAERPMLFIHGSADRFVPYDMLQQNFDACNSAVKQQLTVEGAGHAEAYLREPEQYWQTVFAFLKAAGA